MRKFTIATWESNGAPVCCKYSEPGREARDPSSLDEGSWRAGNAGSSCNLSYVDLEERQTIIASKSQISGHCNFKIFIEPYLTHVLMIQSILGGLSH